MATRREGRPKLREILYAHGKWWAWQNAHLTRHISPNSRLTQAQRTIRFSPKTGRARKRAARPRLSLSDRLANLHQLLQTSSFGRWPLRVTFYAEDVFRVWQKWTTHEPKALPSRIIINLDEPSRNSKDADSDIQSEAGIYALDVGYTALKSHLEKSRALLSDSPPCIFCHKPLRADGAMSLVCPEGGCEAVGHVDCFASSFLKDDIHSLVPIDGDCPSCATKLQWVELVKELSLRMRAPKDVDKILKVKKPRGVKAAGLAASRDGIDGGMSEEEDRAQDELLADDDWNYVSNGSESDIDDRIVQSDPSPRFKLTGGYTSNFVAQSEPLIEDSDWDDADVII